MARTCTVCSHPDRQAIDLALVAGEACSTVAARYCTVSARMAVQRHKEAHLPEALSKAQNAREAARADDLLGQVRSLQRKAEGILAKAEAAGDWRNALGAIREARACVELLGKLLGQLDAREPQAPQVLVLDLRAVAAQLRELPGPETVELGPAFWRMLDGPPGEGDAGAQ